MTTLSHDPKLGRMTDNTVDRPGERAPLVLNMNTFTEVTATVCRVNEAEKAPFAWYVAFAASLGLLSVLGRHIQHRDRHADHCCLRPVQRGHLRWHLGTRVHPLRCWHLPDWDRLPDECRLHGVCGGHIVPHTGRLWAPSHP